MQPEHLQQIMSYYLEDAQSHLEVIEQYLLNLPCTIQDPEQVSELFRAARCGVVGGANLLPISQLYITSIHKTGFCLVDCCKALQQEDSLKIDQKLQDLLMQVFYTLKTLIEQLKTPAELTDTQAEQAILDVELNRKTFIEHLNGLVQRSRGTNQSNVTPLQDFADDEACSLEDLESVIDELSLDSLPSNSTSKSVQEQ
ncbi:MAG TPA: hypothetical protein V6C95_15730 [Coleofasciculaceae cyanobacterium]